MALNSYQMILMYLTPNTHIEIVETQIIRVDLSM